MCVIRLPVSLYKYFGGTSREQGWEKNEDILYLTIFRLLKLSTLTQKIQFYVWVVRQVMAVLNLKQFLKKIKMR